MISSDVIIGYNAEHGMWAVQMDGDQDWRWEEKLGLKYEEWDRPYSQVPAEIAAKAEEVAIVARAEAEAFYTECREEAELAEAEEEASV